MSIKSFVDRPVKGPSGSVNDVAGQDRTEHVGRVRCIVNGSAVVEVTKAETGLPDDAWRFVAALGLIGDGTTSGISASWLDVGKILAAVDPSRRLSKQEQAQLRSEARRVWAVLEDWQEETGYRFVRREGGGMDFDGDRYPNLFTLPVLDAQADALRDAGRSHLWRKGGPSRTRAIREALGRRLPQLLAVDDADVTSRPRKGLCRSGRASSTPDATARRALTLLAGALAQMANDAPALEDTAERLAKLADEHGGLYDALLQGLQRGPAARRGHVLDVVPKDDEADAARQVPVPHTCQPKASGFVVSDKAPKGVLRDLQGVTAPNVVRSAPFSEGGNAGGAGAPGVDDARRAGEAMADAEGFVVTLGSSQEGGADLQGRLSPDAFARRLPQLLEQSDREGRSLIVRPTGLSGLTQLDDVTPDVMARVRPFARLVLETSPGSFQAWLVLDDASAARRLVAGTGADPSASGATRWPGSRNWKHSDAPTVRVASWRPGVTAKAVDLERAGLLAPAEKPAPRVPSPKPQRPHASADRRGWPDYSRELGRHRNGAGEPDSLRADAAWCAIARDRGHDADAVASRLREVSDRARRGGRRYVERTIALAFGGAHA